MDWRRENGSWVGRGELPGDFYDLAVSGADDWEDEPSADAVARLVGADVQALFAEAVRATCEAREAALMWKAGPPLADWSLAEMRMTAAGALWLSIHEYETDEYSLWMVRFEGGAAAEGAAVGDLIGDLTQPSQQLTVLKGGRGGRGNQHFATSRNQAPRTAEKGAPAEE
ncbi:MAG: hypothetical protein V4808_13460, partial [Pseudomonadota bacterium]